MKKVLAAFVLLAAAAVFGEERLALVIGNADYEYAGELRGADSDAELMADTLGRLGFTVDTVFDADVDGIRSAVERFADDLSRAGDAVGFFYYAGYAFQAGNRNYLVPVDSRLQGRESARRESFPVDDLLSVLEGSGARLNIVVLDACRELPTAWAGSGAMGLAAPSRPPRNHIVMFSAGARAYETQSGVFVEELTESLRSSDAEIKDLLQDTADAVADATDRRQRPALSVNFSGNYYLTGNGPGDSEQRQAESRQSRDTDAVEASGEETDAAEGAAGGGFNLEFKVSLGIMAGYTAFTETIEYTDPSKSDRTYGVDYFFATPIVLNARFLIPLDENLRFGLGLDGTYVPTMLMFKLDMRESAYMDMAGTLALYAIAGYDRYYLHVGYDFATGGLYLAPFVMLTDHFALGATFTLGSNKLPGFTALINSGGQDYTEDSSFILAGLSLHWVF